MAAQSSSNPPPEDRYEILGRIAVGGMAEIYLAKDIVNEREVVLKRLMPGLQSDPEFVRMFYDEANIAARLRHPNIVTIHELGELDGSLFIAMELLPGVNLREMLVRLEESGRSLPVGLGIIVAVDALAALDYAHRYTDQFDRSLKVVHRDVSPQNIIVTYEGDTKLLDFGVAKAEGRLHVTRAGLIKGKFSYMSPEQLTGATVDGRSDLFALGEVLYEIFARKHPFYAEAEMDMLRGVLDDDPPSPAKVEPQLPDGLSKIIMRSLQKLPEDRYGTAGLMKKDLEQLAARTGISLNRGLLARFVQDLFRERLTRLEHARTTEDLDALVHAMRVVDAAPAPRPNADGPMIAPDEPSRYAEPEAAVVEVASSPVDPAESAPAPEPGMAPAPFVAQGGAKVPDDASHRYEKSDVFEAPKLDTPTVRKLRADLEPESPDGADLPTVMGQLSPGEMAELREAAAQVRAASPNRPDPSSAPRTQQAPTYQAPDPAERPLVGDDTHPTEGLTHRSQTIIPADDSSAHDRGGLVFFIAGVVALVAAVAYAAYLFLGKR